MQPYAPSYRVSDHARIRGQQRGIRPTAREIVFAYGDRETPGRDGCYVLSISRGELAYLVEIGAITPGQAERCARIALVTDGRTVVTNYHHAN